MVLVEFDLTDWFWSILAGKTGCLPNKLILVSFGRKSGFGCFRLKKLVLDQKNVFWSILTAQNSFGRF